MENIDCFRTAEFIKIIVEIIVGCATVFGIIYTAKKAGSWLDQLRGKDKYSLAKEFIQETYKIRKSISDFIRINTWIPLYKEMVDNKNYSTMQKIINTTKREMKLEIQEYYLRFNNKIGVFFENDLCNQFDEIVKSANKAIEEYMIIKSKEGDSFSVIGGNFRNFEKIDIKLKEFIDILKKEGIY